MPESTRETEPEAYRAIMERFAEWAGEGEAPSMDELIRIASSCGAYPPEHVAEEAGREALMILLGVGWGVGPKAPWRSRLRAWWSTRREAVA